MLWEAYLRSSQARTSRMLRDRRALAVLATCYILLYLWGRPRLQQTARSLAARSSAARLGALHAPLSAAGSFPARDRSGARARTAAQRSAPGGSDWEDLPALGDSEEPDTNSEGRVQLALRGAAPTLRPWRTGRVAAAEDAADAEEAHGQGNLSSTARHGGRRTGSKSAASMPGQSDVRGSRALRRRGAGAAHVHVDIQRGASAAHAQALRVRRAAGAERGGGGDAENDQESLDPEPPGELPVNRQYIKPRVHNGVRTRALRYEAFALRAPRFPSAADAAWFAGLPWVAARRAANAACPAQLALCAGLAAQDGSPDTESYLSPGASAMPQRFVFWEPEYTSGALDVVPHGRLAPSDALYSDCGWHSGARPCSLLAHAASDCVCSACCKEGD